MTSETVDNTPTVLFLLFLWIVLTLALVYFYKKLNSDTNGQYTVQNIVLAPGGLRDQLRQGIGVVENRLGVHIWPQPREDEENIRDGDDEDGHDKQNDSYTEEQEQENNADRDDDSSSDYSSVDLRERAKMQMVEKKSEKNEDEEQKPKEEEKTEDVKNEEKVGLLVDLTPFTGSAIWSEESKEKNEGNDFTAL